MSKEGSLESQGSSPGASDSGLGTQDSGPSLERRVPTLFAIIFYGFPVAIAWVLLYNSVPGKSAELWTVAEPVRTLAALAALCVGLLTARWILLRTLKSARALESEFGWIVGRQRKAEIVFLALLSGVAEEYLFRGWLQVTAGLWVAAGIFAVLHWPINRNFLLWPLFAFVAGAAFGWATEWTGNLVAAAAAHAAYNGVALWGISDRFADWDSVAVERYIEGRA